MSAPTLQIVIPMAGRGQRFRDAGYSTPKPLIELDGCSLVEIVVANVTPSRPHRIIVCALAEHLEDGTLASVLRRVAPDVEIVAVDALTDGPATTVGLAASLLDPDAPLLVANSDQYVDIDIDDYLASLDASDGSIMTFHCVDDAKWSYVQFEDVGTSDHRVVGVVEKVPVSDQATVGIYTYARAEDFLWAASEMRTRDIRTNGEIYVAPGYTLLAGMRGLRLATFDVTGRMHGLGVPADLEAFVGDVRQRATDRVRALRSRDAVFARPERREMSRGATQPAIVILPGEDLDGLALTLESLAAVMPSASIHLVRPGIPAIDTIADLVGRSGLQVIDASAAHGFDAMLQRIDRRFGQQRWCWLFAGEELERHHASTLATGGQLSAPTQFAWLERPSPLAALRVRADGTVVRTSRRADLAPFMPPASWRPCFLERVRAAFSSYSQVYDDVCLLTHLGELDAAYQRAEQAWQPADGQDKLRLARAAAMLSTIIGVSTTSLPACAYWFSVEPEPYVALTYARLAVGSVPYSLVDRLLALLPEFGPVVYRDGLIQESSEHVATVRHAIQRERMALALQRESIVRMMRAGVATPGEIGHAISASSMLGLHPARIVDELADGPQDPMLADCVNVNLDADFVAELIAAMALRFPGAPWLRQIAHRFVLGRTVEAALALDRCGVTGLDHWTLVGSAAWVPGDVRERAIGRAVIHGEIDPETQPSGSFQAIAEMTEAVA